MRQDRMSSWKISRKAASRIGLVDQDALSISTSCSLTILLVGPKQGFRRGSSPSLALRKGGIGYGHWDKIRLQAGRVKISSPYTFGLVDQHGLRHPNVAEP